MTKRQRDDQWTTPQVLDWLTGRETDIPSSLWDSSALATLIDSLPALSTAPTDHSKPVTTTTKPPQFATHELATPAVHPVPGKVFLVKLFAERSEAKKVSRWKNGIDVRSGLQTVLHGGMHR